MTLTYDGDYTVNRRTKETTVNDEDNLVSQKTIFTSKSRAAILAAIETFLVEQNNDNATIEFAVDNLTRSKWYAELTITRSK